MFTKDPITVTGGCYCRAIRYAINVPPEEDRPAIRTTKFPIMSVDHCDDCRRSSGSLLTWWFVFPPSWIHFTMKLRDDATQTVDMSALEAQNASDLSRKTFLSHFSTSDDVRRLFCGNCGTNLTYMWVEKGVNMEYLDITLGSVDREFLVDETLGFCPISQSWWESGIDWVRKWMVKGMPEETILSTKGKPWTKEQLKEWLDASAARETGAVVSAT